MPTGDMNTPMDFDSLLTFGDFEQAYPVALQ